MCTPDGNSLELGLSEPVGIQVYGVICLGSDQEVFASLQKMVSRTPLVTCLANSFCCIYPYWSDKGDYRVAVCVRT